MRESESVTINGVYLLAGTNLGDRRAQLAAAAAALAVHGIGVVDSSAIYRTAAWGNPDQPDFYNQVLRVATSLDPGGLVAALLAIERQLGRTREGKWGPRTIDLDLLLYGEAVIETADVTVPHPRMHLRRFTLVPLNEIAPFAIHPVLRMNVRQLLEACPDTLPVERIAG